MKLTTSRIKDFTYHGGWDVRWDEAVPGMGVRIYPSGKKAFVLSYRAQGRKRLMVLGRYGADLTLDQARARARKERVKVAEGGDPLEEKQRSATGETFGDLIAAYIERHAKVHKKSWAADERRLNRHIPAGWKRRKVDTITRKEIADLHANVGSRTPYDANRLLEILRKMFGLAAIWGFIDDRAPNPAKGIQRFRERKRKRFVTREELPRLAKAIDQQQNIYVRATIWLLLLTGLRRSELLEAKWQNIDWVQEKLRLPDTKAGEEQSATLNSMAMAILQSLPRVEGNPYIIVGAKPGQHLIQIDKPWRAIRKAAKLEDVRLHDLRRTTGSWMAQSNVNLNLIKEALRHASISTTLIYARLGEDPAREAFEQHGRHILEAAGRRGLLTVVEGGGKPD